MSWTARWLTPLLLLACFAADVRGAENVRADREAFDAEFEFATDPSTPESPTEPDYYRLLRKSIRRRRSKPPVYYVPSVTYGVQLTGPSKYHEGVTKLLPPASTNKIFTAALILKELGPDFVYETKLTWVRDPKDEAGYVTLVGSGDPSLKGADVPALVTEYVAALAASGVRRVVGPLRFSETDARWKIKTVPEGWLPRDLGTATGSIFDALGSLAPAKIEAAFRRALAEKGIQWSTKAKPAFKETSAGAESASHFSQPLREIIRPCVLDSINAQAEAFLRKVGEIRGARTAPNLHVAGLTVLREYVMGMLGPVADADHIVLNDGSGLSRTSRVTARILIQFLTALKSEPYFADFLAALPVAGRTGTLEERMKNTAAEGRVQAKTGTLDGHYQIAGYLTQATPAGPLYHPFAILSETRETGAAYVRAVEDDALAAYADWMLKN